MTHSDNTVPTQKLEEMTSHDPKLGDALRLLVAKLEALPEQLRGPFVVDGLKPYMPAATQKLEAEPVAWRWKWGIEGKWFYDPDRPDESPGSPYAGKLSAVEPLYAHPPEPAKVVAPVGWKLMPVDPSEEMLDAGLEALQDQQGASAAIVRDALFCYRAMVHDAPQSMALAEAPDAKVAADDAMADAFLRVMSIPYDPPHSTFEKLKEAITAALRTKDGA